MQDYHHRYPILENGTRPTFVQRGWSSMRSDFQSLTDTSELTSVQRPAFDSLATCNNLTLPTPRATVGANIGVPVLNTVAEPMSTSATMLAAAKTMEMKRGPDDTLMSRPSSLHLAVLDVGWRDMHIRGGEGATKSNEPSVPTVSDVNKRPGGYTGAWPQNTSGTCFRCANRARS